MDLLGNIDLDLWRAGGSESGIFSAFHVKAKSGDEKKRCQGLERYETM